MADELFCSDSERVCDTGSIERIKAPKPKEDTSNGVHKVHCSLIWCGCVESVNCKGNRCDPLGEKFLTSLSA